jgi:hypothetical protein
MRAAGSSPAVTSTTAAFPSRINAPGERGEKMETASSRGKNPLSASLTLRIRYMPSSISEGTALARLEISVW